MGTVGLNIKRLNGLLQRIAGMVMRPGEYQADNEGYPLKWEKQIQLEGARSDEVEKAAR